MRLNYILGVGIVLSLIGASLLVAFGLLYLRPHLDVRHLVEGQCITWDIGFTGDTVICTCASDGGRSACQSQYPCLRVTVNVSSKGEWNFVAANATLYDSYETYALQSSSWKCSYHKCSRSLIDNNQAVESFKRRFVDTYDVYRCYYDPENPSHALLEVVSVATAVNAIVWPALATVCGLSLFLFQIFHADGERERQKSSHQFSSLERQWSRVRERHYGRIVTETGGCSERLVSDANLGTDSSASHNAVCISN